MQTTVDELERMVEGCIQNDRTSQEKFYKRFAPKMFAVCMSFTKDYEDAKDLMQEGFIKVFKNISKYDRLGSLEGWVRRVIVNTAIDHIRVDKNKYFFVQYDSEADYESVQVENDAVKQLSTEDFYTITKFLPAGYKIILTLFVVEGYSHEEIAEKLKISVGTSKSQLAKAKKKLLKTIGDYLDYKTVPVKNEEELSGELV
ncbi:MAG: RNA polymerase sigma factor [Bacteroidota bacterium]